MLKPELELHGAVVNLSYYWLHNRCDCKHHGQIYDEQTVSPSYHSFITHYVQRNLPRFCRITSAQYANQHINFVACCYSCLSSCNKLRCLSLCVAKKECE